MMSNPICNSVLEVLAAITDITSHIHQVSV